MLGTRPSPAGIQSGGAAAVSGSREWSILHPLNNCNLCQRLQLLSGCNIDRANRRVAAASTEYLWLASDISMGQNMLPRTAPFRGGILAAWPHIIHGFLGPPVCRAHAYVQPTDVQTLRLTDHHGTSVIIARILALCASSVPNAV